MKTNENEDFHRENDVEIDNEDSFHRENSTVKESILNNSKEALNQGIITIEVILGIVSGMLFASVIMAIINANKKKRNYIH